VRWIARSAKHCATRSALSAVVIDRVNKTTPISRAAALRVAEARVPGKPVLGDFGPGGARDVNHTQAAGYGSE
jgi:hypothetical protein